jgi:HEAT repeats
MVENKDNPETLNIRCPGCRLRFSVPSDYMNRVVECGGCDNQFRITEDTIVHSKKVYPKGKKDLEANQFRRIPNESIAEPKGMQTINYADFNHPEQLGPASPQRIIAGIFGIAIMLLGALLLFIASKPQSPLGGMPFEKQLIVGGFTSLLGFIFLVYANPSAKIKAGLIGLLLTAGVFAIPVYTKQIAIKPNTNSNSNPEFGLENPDQAPDLIQELRKRFLTQPLEKEQNRLAQSSSGKKAYGIYLTDMLGRNKLNARDYLVRETLANPSSHPYPRDGNNHLIVLTDVEMDFDQVADIADKLGKVTETHPEISVIVVKVDNELFVAGSAEKLNDKNHPSFYELNHAELQSIDLGRVQLAVERLADSDAALLRSDISTTLIKLLEKPSVTFHDPIARGLIKWCDDPGPAADAGIKILKTYVLKKSSPPEHLVRLVANHKNPEAIPTMVAIWETNPVIWDKELVKYGSPIEPSMLEKLSSDEPSLRHAAIKMLATIGTKQSLPELRKILTESDPEVRVLAERAIQQIESR